MSDKLAVASTIAGALVPAERSMNQAAIDLLKVGTTLFEARNSGHFHPLLGQRAVEKFSEAFRSMVEATGHIARTHDAVVQVAVDQKIMNFGDLCPAPGSDVPHGSADVIDLPVAA